MIRVRVVVPNPDQVLAAGAFGAGALIAMESSATEDGTYAALATSPTQAVVSGTYVYEFDDAAGDATTWYRWRFTDSGGATTLGNYSDPVQGEEFSSPQPPESYATLDELLLSYGTKVTASGKQLARMAELLKTAATQVNEKMGWDFWNHLGETRYYDGDGTNVLCEHEGINDISAATLSLSWDLGQTFTDLAATDWYAEPLNPRPGYPWFHLRLRPYATYTFFPAGYRTIKLAGAAFGWQKPPRSAAEANLQRARQLIAADPSLSGIAGPEELGRVMASNRIPDAMYQLQRDLDPKNLGTWH